MTTSNIKYALPLLLLAALAVAFTGCGHKTVSSDPTNSLYKKPDVDFSSYDTVVYEFTDITTTNNLATDVVELHVNELFKMQLRISGLFGKVMAEGEEEGEGESEGESEIEGEGESEIEGEDSFRR